MRSAISRLIILSGIAFSSFVGLLSLYELGDFQFSVSGGITGLLFVASGIMLAINLIRERDFSPVALLALFWAFVAFVALRSIGTANTFSAVTHFVIIATYVIAGSLAIAESRSRTLSMKNIDRWLGLAPLLPMSILLGDLVFGDLTFTSRGFSGSSGLSSRILALFLIPFLSIYLSRWRTGEGHARIVYGVASALTVTVILLSLSRTVAAATIAVLLPTRFINRTSVAKSVVPFLLAGLLLILWFLTPPIQQRFTPSEATASDPAAKVLGGIAQRIETQGRLKMWSVVWPSALESPIFGNGTGTASVVISEVFPLLEHPHNDYLRVFHDLGVVGLVLFVGAWLYRIYRYGRLWLKREDSDPLAARFHMTALLSALGMSVVFITDNALLYVFVGIPVFIQFGLAEAAELQRHENRVRN